MFRVFSCLTAEHDWRLVALAATICFLTSLAAISLFRRARETHEGTRAAWIATAGAVGGGGIWATHFIAMLAYEPGIAIGYDIGLTLLSLATAALIAGAGLTTAIYGSARWGTPLGGAVIGAGVASMHYLGMAALDVPAHKTWSADLVGASIVFGVLFAIAALAVAARHGARATLAAAALLTLAITSHHFTAMGAVTLVPDPALNVAALAFSPVTLAMATAGVTATVLAVALVGATIDQFLANRNLQLNSALQNISQGLLMFNAAGRLVLCNERYGQIYGLAPHSIKPYCTLRQILQQRVAAGTFVHDIDAYVAEHANPRQLNSFVVDLPDGREIIVREQPITNGGWMTTHEDITELKRREASFRLLFENNPIPMWVTDRDDLRFLDVNAAAVAHYGYSREQFLSMTLLDIKPVEDREEACASAGLSGGDVQGLIRRHIRADGSRVDAVIYKQSLSYAGRDAALVAAIDVTARKLVENELRRTRTFLDTVIENVPAMIVVREATGDHRYVLVNRAFETFFNTSRDEVIGKTIHDVLPQSAVGGIEAHDRQLLEQGDQLTYDEHPIETPHQGIRYTYAQRLVVRDNGKPRYLLTVLNDVTESKWAKEHLLETNKTLQAVIDASPVAIVGTLSSGQVLIWNRNAESLFGYSAQEAIGRPVAELIIPPDEQERFREFRTRAFSGERIRNCVTRRMRKDGSDFDARVATAPVLAEDGTVRAIVVAIEDISQSKLLEEQLRQSQKMEAIGQLTGGLSHDFNNLLAIIIGNLDLLRDQIGWNPDAADILEEALRASLRGADLNRRLLAFARRQPLQPKHVDLNELVTGMIKLLKPSLGEHIEVVSSAATGLWPVLVDPGQLESALANLSVNARDAMPGGGRLTIGTRNISIDKDYAEAHSDVKEGDYVVLEVSDTGTGMPPEVLAHVFEPFFTTKAKEKGTGLGLSMVFGFVKQSGGHIQVYSEVGVGTTVRLYLPRGGEAAAEPKPSPRGPLPVGHETILAVEDNDEIRRLLMRQLADLGYRVLDAGNPQAAMEVLKSGQEIDLLFTDVVLPGGMNGWELARAAGALRPELKVLFTSGFPQAAFGSDGAVPAGAMLLGKPYRRDELARRLREALAA